ncbi:MAG TPA: type II toxin-antitoxin system VapC family toxin, partial [Candidatus Binatia bacterium]|nr:type II toxin-antitoxin system VapC family toxin [Candidatus Binatia bacterium]
ADADPPLISTATLLEVNIVMLNRHGSKAVRMVDRLIKEAGFQVESFTVQQAELAREAYARYGKGRQTAGLNYGDCFSYALAKAMGCRYCSKGRTSQKLTSYRWE